MDRRQRITRRQACSVAVDGRGCDDDDDDDDDDAERAIEMDRTV